MNFRILGVLEVADGERQLDLGGAKQRAVLAILILRRGEAISTDRLIDELWGERPPATAAKTVQVYISHLRKALGEGVVATRGRAYVLDVTAEQIDAGRFERLAAQGREELRGGDPVAASATLREGLALWRGSALAEFAYEPFAQGESARLEEARLGALEDRIDADLARGEHASLCPELEALVDEHPLRERLQGQLMLALYRAGRQAEALERYAAARRSLQDELGIEPGRELQELQRGILEQDPALDPPARPSPVARAAGQTGLRRGAVVVTIGGLLLVGVAIGAIVTQGSEPGVDLSANSVAVIDAESGEVEAGVSVGARPGEIAAGEGAVWVANLDDASISQIEPASSSVVATTVPGGAIDGIAVGAGAVWVSDVHRGVVAEFDPGFRRVVARIRISSGPQIESASGPVAVGDGSVWVGDGNAAIARIDPARRQTIGDVDVGNSPAAVAVGGSDVWVADDVDNTVSRIATQGTPAVTATIPVGPAPRAIAVGEGGVWVAGSQADEVIRIDPRTAAVTDTIAVGEHPTGIAVGEGGVWVANSRSGTVSRIDPGSREVDLTVEVGHSPHDVTVADGRVWATLDPSIAEPSATTAEDGGTMRVLLSNDPADVDPAQYFFDPQRAYATCATLFNYPDQPTPTGSTLEPEVATGPPEVSDSGRTYTFTISPDFTFSPPSNEPVTAASFERAIQRALTPELRSYGAEIIPDIVGAKAYASDPQRGLAGVSVSGDQLVVRLTRPTPDFVSRISAPWFCAVPPDTPATPLGGSVVPSAGPYYVESYVPKRSIVLRRNPNYEGPRPAGFDEIEYEIGVPPERAVAEVEAGDADYYSNNVIENSFTPGQLARLDARYGAHSEAASAGAQRLFVTPQLAVYYLLLNTARAPFDDPQVRRAVNYAVDRRALARVPFPSATGRPTDQLLPPGLPGFSDQTIYPLGGPDVDRARGLAGPLDASAVLYVCNLPPCLQLGETVRANLARIGITVEVRAFAIPELFKRISTPGEPFDLAQYNYFSDFADPFDFINFQFQTGVALNSGLFTGLLSDPALDRRMAMAASLTGDERFEAYAKLDRDLSEAAPVVPYASGTAVSLFSERIGCQVVQPIYGIDLGRLCVRE